ncbi:MAG: hypothetical protein HRU26_07015 [Psychroserpens sp.]|nr:hypothetical protein [Psychroserpens sp.]
MTGAEMPPEQYNERLAQNEAKTDALHKDVKALADSVGTLGRDFRSAIDQQQKDFREAMEQIQRQFHDQGKTPWGVLASWAGVIILTMTIIGSFYVRDLGRVEDDVQNNGIAILHHIEKSPSRRELELEVKVLQLQIDFMKEKLNNQ